MKLGDREPWFGRRAAWFVALGFASLLVLILCARLLFSAYTSGDDGYTSMAAAHPAGIWAATVEMAKFQGRFYQMIYYPLALIPFVGDNIVVANLFKIYTFLFFMVGLWWFTSAMFQRWGGLACVAIFLCGFDTVGGSYNPFHGLPLWFALGFGFLLFACGYHWRASAMHTISRGSWICYSAALLSYEIVILYLPLLAYIAYLHESRGPQSKHRISRIPASFASIRPHILCTAAYLCLYVSYRALFPGTYSGASGLSLAPLSQMLAPVLAFSLHGFHWGYGMRGTASASVESLIYASAGVGALLITLLADRSRSEHLASSRPSTWLSAAVLVGYIFIPNVLFGFTERYRIWAGDGVQFYLGSIYSAAALTVLSFLVLRWLAARFRLESTLHVAVGLTLLFGLFLSTYTNSRNSEAFFDQSALMKQRWAVAEWAAKRMRVSGPLAANPGPELVVCGQGFSATAELPVYFRNPDLIADVDIYWSRYFSRLMQRGVRYVGENNRKPQQHCDAMLRLSYFGAVASLEVAGSIESITLDPMPR
jgi:hypothetical protein